MKKRLPKFTIIAVLFMVVLGYFLSEKYIKQSLNNITPKSIIINDLSNGYKSKLTKHKEQESIFQLELKIKGKTNENVSLFLGSKAGLYDHSIRIKGGEIDIDVIRDWYNDDAYLFIDTLQGNNQLDIEYQFIGMKN